MKGGFVFIKTQSSCLLVAIMDVEGLFDFFFFSCCDLLFDILTFVLYWYCASQWHCSAPPCETCFFLRERENLHHTIQLVVVVAAVVFICYTWISSGIGNQLQVFTLDGVFILLVDFVKCFEHLWGQAHYNKKLIAALYFVSFACLPLTSQAEEGVYFTTYLQGELAMPVSIAPSTPGVGNYLGYRAI